MSDAADEPEFLSIRCESCQARLRIRLKLAGTVGTCPKCRSQISIPIPPEIDFELPQSPGDQPPLAADGGYQLAEGLDYQPDDSPEPLPVGLQQPAPAAGYLDQLGQVRQTKRDPPPKLLYFSGVFNFPWYPKVWPRWVFLVLGGTAASLIPLAALTFLESSSGYAGVGLAFFALPQIWITLWTGSYAAACGMQVFEDTAAGNDKVTAWPEPNWREWVWLLLYLGYVVFMVLAVAYGVGLACGVSGSDMLLTIALTEFVLFPISLLSVLEANSILILISPNLALSLIRKPGSWLVFYLLTGGLFAVWFGTLWMVIKVSWVLLILANGLFYATVALIWFRLLGRLAWSISHRRPHTGERGT